LVVTLTPGPHPFEQLWKAVRQAGADEVDWRADRLDLLRTLQALLPADESRLLLVVDQFEELVTQTSSPAERDRFVANLVEVIEEPESGIVVLLTVRADFFAHVLDVPSLGRLALEGLVGVVPMSPEQVEVAAAAPAEGVGVGIEPELAAVLVADMTNQPGALPLFQYALTEAFDARTAGVLTRAGYRAVGGLRGAVARRAEETSQTLGDDEREAARQVFLRLVTIGLATEDTRRRVSRREVESLGLPEATIAAVLDAFDRARLLTFDRDPVRGEPTVELAHEALITEWPRLADWLQSVRDDLRLDQRLAAELAQWEASGHEPDYLLTGAQLHDYAGWPTLTSITPTASESDFLDRSRAEHARRVRQRRRTTARLRVLVAAMTAVAVLASGLLVVTAQRGARIEAAAQGTKVRELATAARATAGLDPDLSLLLALEAQQLAESSGQPLPEAVSALHHAVVGNRLLARFGDVTDVAFLPDGRLVVAGDRVRVVDLDGDTEALEIDTGSSVLSVAATADGRWIATGLDGGRLALWDAATGRDVPGLPSTDTGGYDAGGPEVPDIAFDASGDRLASLGAYGWGLDIWSVQSGEVEARRVLVDSDRPSLAFAHDGSRVLTTTRDGVSSLSLDGAWEPVLAAQGLTDLVAQPAGVATTGRDGTVRTWDAAGGPTGILVSSSPSLNALAATDDAAWLAAGGSDGAVHVWTQGARTLAHHLSFSAGMQEIVELALDPTAQQAATVDEAGTASVWDISDVRPGEVGSWPGGGCLAVSPGGDHVAVAGPSARQVVVRNMVDGQTVTTLRVPDIVRDARTALLGLTYTPDGTQVVGTTAVGLQSWETTTGRPDPATTDGLGAVGPVAISADGSRLAAACCPQRTTSRAPSDVLAPVWIATGTRVVSLSRGDGRAVDLNDAGTLLAVQLANGSVEVWDVESLRTLGWSTPAAMLCSLRHDPAGTGSVAFSPDESMLLTAGIDGTARVWDAASGDARLVLDAGGGPVEVAVWTPDGARLVTSSADGVPRVWDAATGHLEAELPAHGTWPHLAVTPDSRHLLTSADGVVRVWLLDTDALVDLAQSRLTRELTATECDRYGVDSCR
jgi:WD40 repeat protein